MSCQPCRIDYLMDKTGLLEGCLIRMQNVMTFGAITDQVSDVQKTNVAAMRAFATKWKKGRACPHDDDNMKVISVDEENKTINVAPPEHFTPDAAEHELHEEGGNIGISSVPGRAFADDRTSGGAGARRGDGTAASARPGAKPSGRGSGGAGRRR